MTRAGCGLKTRTSTIVTASWQYLISQTNFDYFSQNILREFQAIPSLAQRKLCCARQRPRPPEHFRSTSSPVLIRYALTPCVLLRRQLKGRRVRPNVLPMNSQRRQKKSQLHLTIRSASVLGRMRRRFGRVSQLPWTSLRQTKFVRLHVWIGFLNILCNAV